MTAIHLQRFLNCARKKKCRSSVEKCEEAANLYWNSCAAIIVMQVYCKVLSFMYDTSPIKQIIILSLLCRASPNGDFTNCIRLCFSFYNKEDLVVGVKTIGKAVERLLPSNA